MKELGSSTAYNTHNTTSLIRTLKYVSDILQTEEAFTVEEYKHTHTHESSKYLFETLKMRNLSDMNDLYNVQDVVLLAEIIENRFEDMFKKYQYNPRKYNSASTSSSCIQRDLSQVILTLPTCNDHVEVFGKTLTGGFSAVNTRMGFDTEILLPNLKTADFNKMTIDESFKSFKNQNFKLDISSSLMESQSTRT